MEDDPGWPWSRKSGVDSRNPLLLIRMLYFVLLTGVVLFSVLVIFIVEGAKTPGNTQLGEALGILGVGVLVALAAMKFERPLDASSNESLVSSYRTRFLIRMVTAELPALLGVVGTMMTDELWVLLVTVLVCVGFYIRAAPTAAALRREQERLNSQGSPYSLLAALNNPVNQPAR